MTTGAVEPTTMLKGKRPRAVVVATVPATGESSKTTFCCAHTSLDNFLNVKHRDHAGNQTGGDLNQEAAPGFMDEKTTAHENDYGRCQGYDQTRKVEGSSHLAAAVGVYQTLRSRPRCPRIAGRVPLPGEK
jgi:hypothetical protein